MEVEVTADALAWITNIPTPYRVALWRAMAELVRIEIVCLASTEPNRQWQPNLDIGEAKVRLLNVASVRLGHEITIYLPSRDVSKAIRDCRAQVLLIDGWESPSFMAALVAARRRGMTVLGSYRSTLSTHRFQRGPVAWLRRMFFHAVDAVLVSGQASADAVVAMGVPPSRIMRIPYNVVDVEHFHREVAKVRAGLTPRPGHHVLYVGQLVERKNVETALEAWARNRERDDTFTIVGDGPLRNRLRGMVEESGLQHCVHFRGQRQGNELIEEYAWAQTLVLPSTREVWGLVADEALASGLHVVVSTSTGVAQVINDERGVFLARPDEDSLSSALRASRDAWRGPIEEPAVLNRTPDKAALAVLEAAQAARRIRIERKGV